jgi:hypothetical protein
LAATSTYLIRLNAGSRNTIRNSRFNNPGKAIATLIRLSHSTANAALVNNVFVEAAIAVSLFDSSGLFPTNTQILDNRYLSVTTKLSDSGTGTIIRESTDSATKVDKSATANRIYGTDGTGAQTTVPYSSSSTTAGSLVYRGTGGATSVGTPGGSNDATPKSYVDTAITGAKDRANHTGTQAASTITGIPSDMSIVAFGKDTTGAVGAGDFTFGVKLQRALTLTSVTYRCATAGTGDLTVELRKNGAAVSGSSATITSANQVAGGTATGSWSFAAGDILTHYITTVDTAPGTGLIADITAVVT